MSKSKSVKPARRRKFISNSTVMGYLFASPWFISLTLFTIYPIGAVVYYSFTEYKIIRPPEWIGVGNFVELFTVDTIFWQSLYNTFYYTVIAVPLGILVALILATLLNQKLRGITWFRTIFYLPTIVPLFASAILWLWILNPMVGLLNIFLAQIGIKGPGWLASETWSKPALIIMSTWAVGGSMIIFLAGLQGIPRQLYEAADIDGANSWHKFRHVTVPMLSPTIFFNLVMGIIGSFQIFTHVYIMTGGQGGPVNSTMFYVLYLYKMAFQYLRMGMATAMALILFFIILALTLAVFITSGKWVYYEVK